MPPAKRFSFTISAINDESVPKSGRTTVWDTRIPKLCLRITSGGAKTFYYVTKIQTENGPKTEWNKLGRFPELTPEAARTAAQVVAGKYAQGDNPAEDKRQDRAEWSVGRAWDEYEKHRVRKLQAQGKSDEKIARALESHRSHWKHRFSQWENRRLSAISGGMTEKLQDSVLDERSPATVNRVIASGRAVFNFAIKRQSSGFEGPNPFSNLEKFPETRRKTKLQRHQIPSFFEAIETITPLMRDFILTALWTGRRASDIKSMRWVDVDLETGTWLIPDTKAGEPQEVALSLPAIELLSCRLRESKSQWVFPGHGKSGHIEEYKKAWQTIRDTAGLGGLRLHDLRRTLSSFAQENRIAATVAGAQLGHKDPATTLKHYTDIALYAQREAVNVVADAILEAKDGL